MPLKVFDTHFCLFLKAAEDPRWLSLFVEGGFDPLIEALKLSSSFMGTPQNVERVIFRGTCALDSLMIFEDSLPQ